MRNLTGFLKRTLSTFSILLFVFPFFFNSNISAASDLEVFSSFHHDWDGNTLNTTIYLTLSTKSSSTVITYYTITIPEEEIIPEVFSVNRNSKLEPTIHKSKSGTDLVIDLKNTPIYPDKPVTLKITYSKLLSGNTISLVSSIGNTTTKEFSLSYPASLGDISWSSATVVNIDSKGDRILIQTEIPNTEKVKVSFGTEVVYKYSVKKSIVNSGEEIRISEISLPINNSNQHILIDKISPLPDKAYKDIDGNYILQYGVAPQSSIDINIEGYILMNKSVYPYEHNLDIEEISLWKITNTSLIRHINRYIKSYGLEIPETFSNIEDLKTQEEKALLYEAIYKYVIENLKPNTLSIGSLSGSERLGGQEVLLKQGESTTEDYIDSIISIYRYFKIPARFVIGYVSNISNYDSKGMYHYWAEYYDKENNDWVIVEPFLEDYSSTPLWKKNMKDHITLIYRYSDPNTPKLPFYTPEDFKVELIKEQPEITHDFSVELILQPYKISDPYMIGYINITNKGNTILDIFNISKSKPNLKEYVDYIENNSQIVLLPNQTYDIKFNIPAKEIEENLFTIIDALSGTTEIKGIYAEKDIQILTEYSNLQIFSKLISLLTYILISIPIYFISKRVKFKNG